jgi:hypothetical protein
MPVVLRIDGFRFFFYSNEGDPREPVHVHVRRGAAVAKIWLKPDIGVADSHGFDSRTLAEVVRMVTANRRLIERRWHEHFR